MALNLVLRLFFKPNILPQDPRSRQMAVLLVKRQYSFSGLMISFMILVVFTERKLKSVRSFTYHLALCCFKAIIHLNILSIF